jgi:stearoyl-CoA desaturase (Delta-9 desaturase)
MVAQKELPLDWRNIFLLTLVHVVALIGTPVYLFFHGLSLAAALIGLVLTVMTIFSISAGYHRLFSHRAYEAHPVLRFLLLVFGAGAFQNTALAWAADHRRHHGRTDSDLDPYDARRGFWYAHIGWVLRKPDPEIKPTSVRDLERDTLVAWQHRHYVLIGVVVGVGLPVLLGFAFGDPWGGFIVGGAGRLLIVYHATFSINSFAHLFGTQPYSDRTSARDNVFTAFISMGEGYHNFHHAFPADYRNGVGLYQFDPTKWALRVLAWVGLASNLKRAPQPAIVRARLRMDEQRLVPRTVPPSAQEHLKQLRARIDQAVARWHSVAAQYEARRTEASGHAREAVRRLRAEFRAAGRDLRAAYADWKRGARSLTGPVVWVWDA